ncbi:MAG: hypothetical protein AAGB27_16020, partial [Pseudomonadota bacterium]
MVRISSLALACALAAPAAGQLVFQSSFEAGEGGMQLPPNPEDVAPDRDTGYPTAPCDAFGFLYNGSMPVQFGVDESQIDCDALGILGGRVVDRDMNPIQGVNVAIKDRPEFGFTLTRADGEYDLAVNGGGRLTLVFGGDDMLSATREAELPPRVDLTLDDVMLIGLDANVTTIMADMSDPQMITGSAVTDVDGTRTARLMVPANTSMMMDDGAGGMTPMSQLAVRITEYTVGPNGPMAMPADLPPTSEYTYAVEFSADEGVEQPVRFSQPLASYNENFLEFPTGTVIPHGYFDRELGQWVPAENGLVVEILSEAAGTVTLAVDSTGAAATQNQLDSLGISADELTMLAETYAPGASLWRVPVRNFSPHDYNYALPDNAVPPPPPAPQPTDVQVDRSDPRFGRIEYQRQVFQETMDIAGVPFSLHYSSDRTPGRLAERRAFIPITQAVSPEGL